MEIISRETLEQSGRIIHDTEVDIGNKRPVVTPIHIVQYDNTLPVIAVKIYKDGNPHKLPSEYSARIRWKTANGIRYEAVMGRSDLKPGSETEEELFTTLYFTVDVDMTRCFGELYPIIEVSTNNMLSGSSSIPFVIHRNPIQESEIEDDIEHKGVVLAPVATSGSYNDLEDKPEFDHDTTKVDKIMPSVAGRVVAYIATGDGQGGATQGSATVSASPAAYSIAQRRAGGTLSVGTPTEDSDAAPKEYVDAHHDSTKLDATKCTIQTTAPTSPISDGGVHIVVLDDDPTTKYNGYIYLIKERV